MKSSVLFLSKRVNYSIISQLVTADDILRLFAFLAINFHLGAEALRFVKWGIEAVSLKWFNLCIVLD